MKLVSPERNSLVKITDEKLRVEWEGSDKDGDEILYSVYYAPDGKSWRTVSYEQKETFTELDVKGKPEKPTVKIIATDGVRSDEVSFKFYISTE